MSFFSSSLFFFYLLSVVCPSFLRFTVSPYILRSPLITAYVRLRLGRARTSFMSSKSAAVTWTPLSGIFAGNIPKCCFCRLRYLRPRTSYFSLRVPFIESYCLYRTFPTIFSKSKCKLVANEKFAEKERSEKCAAKCVERKLLHRLPSCDLEISPQYCFRFLLPRKFSLSMRASQACENFVLFLK